jgi:hypothetical protein
LVRGGVGPGWGWSGVRRRLDGCPVGPGESLRMIDDGGVMYASVRPGGPQGMCACIFRFRNRESEWRNGRRASLRC